MVSQAILYICTRRKGFGNEWKTSSLLLRPRSMSKPYGWILLKAGAPFAPRESLRHLFVATSKTLEETLEHIRRLLDLIYGMWILWCVL